MKKIFFTPGPSELYFTVESHIKSGLKSHVASINHRSKEFETIHKRVVSNLTELLQIPDSYQIFFISSATEIWERLIQNCVLNTSYHLVNGAFSEKFFNTAIALNRKAESSRKPLGEGFDIEALEIPDTELLAFIHNETSTGVTSSLDNLRSFKKKNPDTLIAVDAVSSLPYPVFDYHNLDSVYFSVQKGFGLPAGLGVWLVNSTCIEKAKQLNTKGLLTGLSSTLLNYSNNFIKHQTPFTPNVLGIYLLEKVTEDMLTKGIDKIRKEIEYKSAVLYQVLEQNPHLEPFVIDQKFRSKTVIVSSTEKDSSSVLDYLDRKGFVIGQGYGEHKNNQIRIANFPTHSKEMVEQLADLLAKFRFS